MKSVMMLVAMVLLSMSMVATNPEWYAVYRMTSTTTTQTVDAKSKTHAAGYLVVGVLPDGTGITMRFEKAGKNLKEVSSISNFTITSSAMTGSWLGSGWIVATSGNLRYVSAMESITGTGYVQHNVCHVVDRKFCAEIIPERLDGSIVRTLATGTATTVSVYRFDLHASQAMNHRYISNNGAAFKLVGPESVEVAIGCLKNYLSFTKGYSLEN